VKRIRIIAKNGLVQSVTDLETGEQIDRIYEARIELLPNTLPMVWLKLLPDEVDVEADVAGIETVSELTAIKSERDYWKREWEFLNAEMRKK